MSSLAALNVWGLPTLFRLARCALERGQALPPCFVHQKYGSHACPLQRFGKERGTHNVPHSPTRLPLLSYWQLPISACPLLSRCHTGSVCAGASRLITCAQHQVPFAGCLTSNAEGRGAVWCDPAMCPS